MLASTEFLGHVVIRELALGAADVDFKIAAGRGWESRGAPGAADRSTYGVSDAYL
jgi:hypothetical protein